jgi:hypothetical protein
MFVESKLNRSPAIELFSRASGKRFEGAIKSSGKPGVTLSKPFVVHFVENSNSRRSSTKWCDKVHDKVRWRA